MRSELAFHARRPKPSLASHVHRERGAWLSPRRIAGGRNRRRPRTATPGRCPVANVTSHPPTEAEARSATPTRGRGARLLPLTRPPPAETNEDQAHGNSRTVSACRRSPERRRPKPTKTKLTETRERCPFTATRRPRPAEAGTGRQTRPRPDGCPVTATRATHPGRNRRRGCERRLPDGCPRSRSTNSRSSGPTSESVECAKRPHAHATATEAADAVTLDQSTRQQTMGLSTIEAVGVRRIQPN